MAEWDGHPVAELRSRWGVTELEAYHVLGSTNDRAAELGRAGAEPLAVVVADEQRSGRGRRGGAWFSPRGGGLWMSCLLFRSPPAGQSPPEGLLNLPLLVGLMTARQIDRLAPEVNVQVKWPNDLLVEGRKLGGILCESHAGGLVVGVGVNLAGRLEGWPDTLSATATTLDAHVAESPTRAKLAGLIVAGLEAVRGELAAMIPAHTLDELQRRDALRGAPLRLEDGREGIGAGIDDAGRLLVRLRDGSTERIGAGSVMVLGGLGPPSASGFEPA